MALHEPTSSRHIVISERGQKFKKLIKGRSAVSFMNFGTAEASPPTRSAKSSMKTGSARLGPTAKVEAKPADAGAAPTIKLPKH